MNVINQIRADSALNSSFSKDWDDLIWGRRAGHMMRHKFEGADIKLWSKFLLLCKESYYASKADLELCSRLSETLPNRIKGPVTLISRGPGTKFLDKESILIKNLPQIVGIVYIDTSISALEQSLREGKRLYPKAWHQPILGDFYDPRLKYRVEGTELNTMFGFTKENIEGFVKDGFPAESAIRMSKGMAAQMQSGAHWITTVDTCQNAQTVEAAYSCQTELCLAMLKRNSIHSQLGFNVRFDSQSHILEHIYSAQNDQTIINTISGPRIVDKGDEFVFTNSIKPPLEKKLYVEKQAGFMSWDKSGDIAPDSTGNVYPIHFVRT